MAGFPAIVAGDALTGAVRSEFLETYTPEYKVVEEDLRDMMRLAIPSDKVLERYVYFESAPHPKRQPRNEEMSFGDYAPKSFTVANHRFAKAVQWHEDDLADDQTSGGMIERARVLGENFALLPERIAFQILLGTTDPDLLPAIPNAPDGAAFFAATAGGVARFGATGGNLKSGSGVATAQAIRSDFWSVVARFGLFQDTKGQPLIHPSKRKKFTIWFNLANEEVFREAFKGQLILRTTTSPGNLAAGTSNTIAESGIEIKLVPTARITDNDWFVRCTALRHYSLFEQSRSPLQEVNGNPSNSDRARLTGFSYMGWKMRSGYGLGLPYDFIQVDN